MPPKKNVTISKHEMDSKFHDGGWEQRLKTVPPNRRKTIEEEQWLPSPERQVLRKRGIKYDDEDGNLLAIVFTYDLADGTQRVSVRALSEGDTTFIVA